MSLLHIVGRWVVLWYDLDAQKGTGVPSIFVGVPIARRKSTHLASATILRLRRENTHFGSNKQVTPGPPFPENVRGGPGVTSLFENTHFYNGD